MERKQKKKAFYHRFQSYFPKRGPRMKKTNRLVPIAIIALLGVFVFAGSGTVSGDYDRGYHTARINLTGSMRLQWYHEAFDITVAQNFTANVPPGITTGTYNGTFGGVARVDEDSIGFNGVIMTENGTFPAGFKVPVDGYNGPTGVCGASGNLTLAIPWTTAPPGTYAYELIQVVGRVTGYGNSPALGNLNANAKISNSTVGENVSTAHVFWVPISGPMPHPDTAGNFTYSFYAARLINTTTLALNYSGYDFYLNGTWNILNVTFSYSGVNHEDFQKTESYARQNATGELKVYGNWMNFTLSISGFEDVKGSVNHFVRHAKAILEGDVLGHGRVDIYDLVYVARRIGSTPGAPQSGGLSNFEDVESADVNFDFHVDIYDLVTVATQIGQTS
jgi:hypothetical protein